MAKRRKNQDTKLSLLEGLRRPLADVELSVPWGYPPNTLQHARRGNIATQAGRFLKPDEMKSFVEVRSDLHATYIKETQRTRRFAMALAAALLALACLVPVFAPEGRETLSYWVGLALFVFAAGAIGYTSVRYKSENLRIEASRESRDA